MKLMNITQVTMFEFSGLTDDKRLVPLLFGFFLLVYLVTICGNVGMMAIIQFSQSLHTPMYYFLSYLSMVDFFYSSVTTPKMLTDLLSDKKSISFVGCALQFFFFAGLASTEVFVLASMSYDRYVAICHPLHYVSMMTKNKCRSLVLISFSVGLVQTTSSTTCMFSLRFCGPNLLDHFYCDIPPVLKLSCSDTRSCEILLVFFVCFCTISSLTIIAVSYILIISCIMRMKSTRGRQKAFSTCSSHLMCATLFYVTVFVTYLQPSSTAVESQNKAASVFYAMMTPMLNPLIYSLRNQEVKRVVLQKLQKDKHR
ncbi:olfactory receptor 5AR1-like [Hyperolius riggenbachi]|uniref:olfactory receptor 5AR1-like n=1 Tax=Hyperolius riggenbachi TaxID=752182 RepID=UPI0035A3CB2F